MAHKAIEAGRVLAGRYRLESRLGEGGMGTIWRAEHLVLGAPVAVKIIDRDVTRDEEALARFNREAQSAAALRSPHVVQIIDFGTDDDVPFLVMELLEGETLAERLRRIRRLSPAETARIITHVARAISRAHEAGIVHRDLKPENVFLVRNEDAEIAKVLDFGVAKVAAATLGPEGTRTRTGSLLGTPFYMSPEQAQGNKTVDYRTDLWALGVIAYECLTGERPFESEGLGDLVLSICVRPVPIPSERGPVPGGFDAWFAKATQREADERFQSAREMAEALREAVGDAAREMQITVSEDDDAWGAVPATAPQDSPQSRLGNAATLQGSSTLQGIAPAPPEKADEAVSARKPSLTVRQFGTTRASEPAPPPEGRLRLIFIVALLALGSGLGGGLLFLRSQKASDTEDALPTAPARTEHVPADPLIPSPPADTDESPSNAIAERDEDAAIGQDAGAAAKASKEGGSAESTGAGEETEVGDDDAGRSRITPEEARRVMLEDAGGGSSGSRDR